MVIRSGQNKSVKSMNHAALLLELHSLLTSDVLSLHYF